MRRRVEYKKNTLDLNKNRGIGIKLPFDPVSVFSITYTTKEQIKSNLINFLLTNKGERFFNPEFGADLRNLLFEQMTDVEEVRLNLQRKIELYFPMISISRLDFSPDMERSILFIKLEFSINNQEDSLSIQIQ